MVSDRLRIEAGLLTRAERFTFICELLADTVQVMSDGLARDAAMRALTLLRDIARVGGV